jgi:NADPH:quinone reductase
MRALRFDRFGDPHVLQVAEVADPVADDGQAVIAVQAASVNPSDVKNVAGAIPATVLPRVPGRDFAGLVVDGPADWIGAEVWGTGGDVGSPGTDRTPNCSPFPSRPSCASLNDSASTKPPRSG